MASQITPQVVKRAAQFFVRGMLAQAQASKAAGVLAQLAKPEVATRMNKQAAERVVGIMTLGEGYADILREAQAA